MTEKMKNGILLFRQKNKINLILYQRKRDFYLGSKDFIRPFFLFSIITLTFISLLFTGCSNNKDKSGLSKIEEFGIQAIDALSAANNFIKNYTQAFNSKNFDSITALYSSAPSVSLETKDSLKELFLSSDTISITFSNLKITVYDIKNLEFISDVNIEINLSGKIINDKRKINYKLANENNVYKLSEKIILKKM